MRKREYFVLFLSFYLLGLCFYSSTFESRVVYDQAEFILRFREQGFGGVFKCFNIGCITSLYLFHFIEFLIYKLFGVNSILNGLFALMIHVLNSVLLVYIFRKVFNLMFNDQYSIFSVLLGVCFLVTPYASEVVVWGCTYHYLFLTLFFLGCIYSLIQYIQIGGEGYRLAIFILYFLCLFLHEISFVLIPVFAIFYVLFEDKISMGLALKRFSILYLVPLALLLFICFGIRLYSNGSIVGHYGAETHLNFALKEILIHYELYSLKYLFLMNSVDAFSPIREFVHLHIWRFSTIVAFFLSIFIIYYRRSLWRRELLLLLIGYSILIFPALNLYFPDYLKITGDRLGYVASTVLYILIGAFLLAVFRKKYHSIIYLYLIVYIVMSCIYLLKYNYYWSQSARIMKKLELTDLGKSNNYFFLNMPESYNGAYMYKGGINFNPFKLRKQVTGQLDENNYFEVLSMNLNDNYKKLNVVKVDSVHYSIEIDSVNGSWFWKGNNGATNYTTDQYRVELNPWGTGYILTILNMPKNSFLLYYSENRLFKTRI